MNIWDYIKENKISYTIGCNWTDLGTMTKKQVKNIAKICNSKKGEYIQSDFWQQMDDTYIGRIHCC